MNILSLIDKRVALMVSDPWDFGTECGVGPFYARITDAGVERINGVEVERALVTLERPIEYSGDSYLSAICSIRHEGVSFNDLLSRKIISLNITLLPIPAKTFIQVNNDNFRKGFAVIGSIKLA